ncbi:Amino-acid acetyltransferase [Sterolibacterium denitrificans]|uniref:Amino-acid acetyltransferase n=1 Tax=Sterolibacterium denitrificans TaxID=157592 RepID=A0A7Z7HSP2_9PROT|nr:amino-acid N-acetyltransferase [Sterolibacterium denitrificans]SMB30783.1 Amino-acid acetyltransferase [Sterolibacterium denitrificans]
MTMIEDATRQISEAALVAWVRQAAPYIHAFRGRTFVIAFGGEVLGTDKAQALAQDFNLLASLGIRLVLVHGARPQIDAEMQRRGLPARFHKGLRVTDAAALECVKSALGVTRIEIEALLSQGLPNTPMAGAWMRVTGGNFITAKPVGVLDGVDHLYTGAVRKIIAEEIKADLDQQNVVLISPLGVSPSGEIFNLALEDVAEAVAVALQAEKLIFLGDAPGLVDKKGQLLEAVTVDEAGLLLTRRVRQAPEVARVLPAALRACRAGVGRVHFLDRNADGAMLMEFFTHAGVGTVMTRSPLVRLREATVDDVGAILGLIAPLEADGTLVKRGRERIEMEISRFSLLEDDGVTVGCAALYPFTGKKAAERVGELACLAVMPEYQHYGYGDQLRRHIEMRAKKLKLKKLFVLTTRTAHWFIERGFVESDLATLPDTKRELYNYQRRSKVFIKTL